MIRMEKERISVNIPLEILPIVAKRRKDASTKIFEYLILELYRLGEISSGKAAQFLEMERVEFIRFACRLGIPFIDMDEEELLKDYTNAQNAREK
ncbi:MAG: UPF0175 family protein [bacterium]